MFYLCVNMYLLLLFRLTVQDKRIDSVATHSSLPRQCYLCVYRTSLDFNPWSIWIKMTSMKKALYKLSHCIQLLGTNLNNFIIKMSDLIRIFIIYIEWEISTEEIWVCIVCWLYISVQTTVYLYNALFDDICITNTQ